MSEPVLIWNKFPLTHPEYGEGFQVMATQPVKIWRKSGWYFEWESYSSSYYPSLGQTYTAAQDDILKQIDLNLYSE